MSVLKYIGFLCLICLLGVSAGAADSFCNRVESGSTINMKVCSLSTQMGSRVIPASADAGTELYNNVLVSEYAPGVPSQGTVTAFIRGSIREEGQLINFLDSTSVIGNISSFSKSMHYLSQ